MVCGRLSSEMMLALRAMSTPCLDSRNESPPLMTPFDSTAMGMISSAKIQGRSLVVPENLKTPAKSVSLIGCIAESASVAQQSRAHGCRQAQIVAMETTDATQQELRPGRPRFGGPR